MIFADVLENWLERFLRLFEVSFNLSEDASLLWDRATELTNGYFMDLYLLYYLKK